MEQTKKSLKITSIIVLVLAGLTLLNVIFELILGELTKAEIPEGSPDNILLITQIFLLVVTVLLLLPQVYIGLKGLKMAKTPDASKGHIIWGIILLAWAVFGMISPLIAVIKQEAVSDNVSTLLSMLVEVTAFFEYVKYARAVAKAE